MYMHLGQDYIVPLSSIIGIFDLDTSTASKGTRALLARLEKEGQVVPVFDDLPRSAVLCDGALGERLYLSQLSSAALAQRAVRAADLDFS